MLHVEKYKRLVKALSAKTAAEEIAWRELSAPQSYTAAFKDNSVSISEVDGRTGTEYMISLINASGAVADSFRDTDLDHPDDPDTPWYAHMRVLYEAARRKALGSDRVLDEILWQVEDQVPF